MFINLHQQKVVANQQLFVGEAIGLYRFLRPFLIGYDKEKIIIKEKWIQLYYSNGTNCIDVARHALNNNFRSKDCAT